MRQVPLDDSAVILIAEPAASKTLSPTLGGALAIPGVSHAFREAWVEIVRRRLPRCRPDRPTPSASLAQTCACPGDCARGAERTLSMVELSAASHISARSDGASPSGKAPVFGTGIRRFESCRPSQFACKSLI